ncbi:hypothetical protein FKP32DRAFT_1677650 [Trametes sanguinea]|nr:hypothetical protein FKP32DRAFT_1677650 [Trametes sanguinea]
MRLRDLFRKVIVANKSALVDVRGGPPLSEADQQKTKPEASGKVVKRALVIGINYRQKSQGADKPGRLRWGYRDARAWAGLLKKRYGYDDSEITLMLDEKGYPVHLRPTKSNILFQIKRLVEGLEEGSGTRVVFYYSGHSGQIATDSINEDDGLDEYIMAIPSGENNSYADNMILDGYLRKHLVERIPKGVYFTAIFDACHSGTMLDLDHYYCNSVFFPWINRGIRRHSKSLWQLVTRKNAILPTAVTDRGFVHISRSALEEAATAHDHARENSPACISSIPLFRGRKKQREDADMPSIASVLGNQLPQTVSRPPPVRAATSQVDSDSKSTPPKKIPVRCYSFNHRFDVTASKLKEATYVFMGIRRQSPAPKDPKRCTGWCKVVGDTTAYIVSISATNDAQLAYDGPGGQSMTQAGPHLRDHVLSSDQATPHISCRELVERLGYEQHGVIRQVHEACRNQFQKIRRKKELAKNKKRQEKLDQERKDLEKRMEDKGENGMRHVLDGSNFQDPTLGSQRPLNAILS